MPRPPVPTPTPEPAAACRFGSQAVSVPVYDPPAPPVPTGTPPAAFRETPGWSTIASGEPVPGVSLDLRLPATTFPAGAVIRPELRVRNATAAEVGIFPVASAQSGVDVDPRTFPGVFPPPTAPAGVGGFAVPASQTWAAGKLVQLPFDAQTASLHVSVFIGTPPINVLSDVPLRLEAPTSAQQLRLEAQADGQQWCLRATDATGARPTGPLFAYMKASIGNGMAFGPVGGGTGDTWAGRWSSFNAPSGAAVTLEPWVAGPNAVTARTQVVATPEAPRAALP